MKVLIACEFSGTVRDAFIARGHDAISCDVLPTEKPGPHIQDDIRNVNLAPCNLLIAHPPSMNPYHLSDEQRRAYAAQITEEKQERATAIPGESIHALKEWLRQDAEAADHLKSGYPHREAARIARSRQEGKSS